MLMDDIVKLIVDNGVTVAVIIYFMFVNYNFMLRIDNTLTALKTVVDKLAKEDDGK